jgi:hypothetical protein
LKQRIIFEPHADDAFLSLGGHIERWKKEGDSIRIVTVYSGTRRRKEDACAYARAVGAQWTGMEVVEGGKSNPQPLPSEIFSPYCVLTEGEFYVPLGFAHPEHDIVRRAVEEAQLSLLFYYLDQPYAMAHKNSEGVADAARDLSVISYLRPHSNKYRHCPLFRDQAKFFFYNPPEKLKHSFELILAEHR